MGRTLAAVRQAVATNLRDRLIGTVSAVATNTITVPEIAHLASDALDGSEMYVYAGTGIGQSRVIQTHTQATGGGTLLPYLAWTTPPDATSRVEIHLRRFGWTTATLNEAITAAHHAAEDVYKADVVDASIATQAGRTDYPIPAGFRGIGRVERDVATDVGVPGSVYDSGALNWGSPFYDQDRPLATSGANPELSQGFSVTAGGHPNGFWMGGAALYLRAVGTPTGTYTLRVETNAGGLPSGSLLDPNGTATVAASVVVGTYAYVGFRFAAPIFCTSGQQLHLTLQRSAGFDAANYVAWGEDVSSTYGRGSAGVYDGASWSVIAGSALIFAVHRSQINEAFVELRHDDADGADWRIVRSATPLLWLREPIEGARLRLTGQGPAAIPAADTDAVVLPESFLVPKATALALAMQGAGPETDADARDRWALFWEKKAEAELVRLHVQWRPNTELVAGR